LARQRLRDMFNEGLRPKIIETGVFAPLRRGTFLCAAKETYPKERPPGSRAPSGCPALRSPNRGPTTGHPAPARTARHPWRAPCGPYPIRTAVLGAAYGVQRICPISWCSKFPRRNVKSSGAKRLLSERSEHSWGPLMARRATEPKAETARRGTRQDGASSAFGAGMPRMQTPPWAALRGNRPKGGEPSGRPFFWFLFFGRAKKRNPAQGDGIPRLINLRAKRFLRTNTAVKRNRYPRVPLCFTRATRLHRKYREDVTYAFHPLPSVKP
jgi:hypothetical protein